MQDKQEHRDIIPMRDMVIDNLAGEAIKMISNMDNPEKTTIKTAKMEIQAHYPKGVIKKTCNQDID